MAVYKLPDLVPFPEPDYRNYNATAERLREQAHQNKLKDYLQRVGYTGPNTGKIYRTPVADGYAQYMLAERGRKLDLFHLPYGDAWAARDVAYLPKKVILERVQHDEKIAALFAKKGG